MIKYEVHVAGQENPYYTFETYYQFSSQERLFVPNTAQDMSLVITKITHDLTQGHHVVRLNCMFKKSHG